MILSYENAIYLPSVWLRDLFPTFHIHVRRFKRNDCRDQILNFVAVRNSSSAGEKNNIDLTTDK